MDWGWEIIFYVVALLIYMVSRAMKKEKKGSGPPSQQNRPRQQPEEEIPSWEDLLKEITGESPRKAREPEPQPDDGPVSYEETDIEIVDYDEQFGSYEDPDAYISRQKEKEAKLKTIDELVDYENIKTTADRLDPYAAQVHQQHPAFYWLQDMDEVRKGIIMKEILDRKF